MLESLRVGIVIPSRLNSSRIKEKPLQKINDVPIIQHLIWRCLASGFPVCLAIPAEDYAAFSFLKDVFNLQGSRFSIFTGHKDSPIQRMYWAAKSMGWDYTVRVCHDKILVDPNQIIDVVRRTAYGKSDYGFVKDSIDGTSFEVISFAALSEAAERFPNMEHISYAVRAITNKIFAHVNPPSERSGHRLLIDYPDDLKVMTYVFRTLGNQCDIKSVVTFLDQHAWISRINRLPRATIYTCAYNAEKWVTKAMGSVAMQQCFNRYEYILVDDFSTDATSELMKKYSELFFQNVKYIRNPVNLGLASSSNVALTHARGKYIMRLDADDYLISDTIVEELISEIEKRDLEALYPNNYFGSFTKIQKGYEHNHVGGALFKTSAANQVKFTEQLRGYEGFDFFARGKELMKIGYHDKPTFFYRQHDDSLTKNNLIDRSKLFEELRKKHGSK